MWGGGAGGGRRERVVREEGKIEGGSQALKP